jgi:hypothetical protein
VLPLTFGQTEIVIVAVDLDCNQTDSQYQRHQQDS